MKKYDYANLETCNFERSSLHNLPYDCKYCAYRLKPSSAGYSCSIYCKQAFKTNKMK
jgi:hypothetical protein